jgi:hypothetical protein
MVLRLGYNMGSQGTFIPPHFGPDGFWVVGQFEIRAERGLPYGLSLLTINYMLFQRNRSEEVKINAI